MRGARLAHSWLQLKQEPIGCRGCRTIAGGNESFSSASVPDVELTPRKAVVDGNFARNLETASGLVSQVASLALYGIGFDEINRYITNVQGITASDVQKFAGEHLAAINASIIVVGNARNFCRRCANSFHRWK